MRGTNAKELFLISPEEATIIVEEIILENKTAQEAIAREKAKWAENERLRKIREKEKLEKERARLEEIERLRKQRQREIDREMLIQARRIEAWNKSDVNFEYKANKIKIKNFKSKLLKIEKSYKYIYQFYLKD